MYCWDTNNHKWSDEIIKLSWIILNNSKLDLWEWNWSTDQGASCLLIAIFFLLFFFLFHMKQFGTISIILSNDLSFFILINNNIKYNIQHQMRKSYKLTVSLSETSLFMFVINKETTLPLMNLFIFQYIFPCDLWLIT